MRQYPVPPASAQQQQQHQQEYVTTLSNNLWHFNNSTSGLPSLNARKLEANIERAARNPHFGVLITGETGTGKTLAAYHIHERSTRASRPFKELNCAAVPENLFESELFGFRKGAFTGADRDHPGLFEDADGGTLFLDEIGEIPLSMQNKLLKAIDEKKVKRLGTNNYIECDIRILAATSRDLEAMVAARTFREDLYCRLSVLRIEIVPLRERREDIPALLNLFLCDAARLNDREHPFTIETGAVHQLLEFDFPGNIRRLRNMVYELTSYVVGDAPIRTEDVCRYLANFNAKEIAEKTQPREGEILVPVEICIIRHGETLKQWEARVRNCAIEAARRDTGRLAAAASRLGVSHSTLKQHLRSSSRTMMSVG